MIPSGLVYVVWEITLRCDLACGHCGSRAGKPRADELTTAEALDLVRQIAEMGAQEVTLIGGEAYLRDDWMQIARAIRDAGMTCTMTTGGRGMTPERAKAAFDAGVQSVSVSIDGMGPSHDMQRGVAGSFDAARAAIGHLAGAGMQVAVNSQINRISYPELGNILDLIVEEGGHSWQVQFTVPMGRAADRPEWLMQPYELLHVIPRVAELAVEAERRGVRVWTGNNVGYFGPHETELRRWTFSQEGHASSCGAGMGTLGIEADGAIKGCPSLPTKDWTGGHIRQMSLRRIWDTTKELRYTRDRTVDDLWGFCRTCYYADVCRAGCTWTSHVFFGRPGNNPYCHHRALEHQSRGLRERLVQVKAPPGEAFDHGVFDIVVEPYRDEEVARLPLGKTPRNKRLPIAEVPSSSE
ncbi:MAG: radical SAM protein [Polyangiaceae bacterium]|nr:radical SAM protein [Polyangiaceae bacterium]